MRLALLLLAFASIEASSLYGQPVCSPKYSYCMFDNCLHTRCAQHVRARCRNVCHTCTSQYLDKWGRDITKKCRCPGRIFEAECKEDLCKDVQCAGYPDVECRINSCGGCKAEFYLRSGRQITCKKVDVCKLPKVTGPCFALMQRYYHNKISGKCEPFTYGGCKGNGNNFQSLAECNKKCPPVQVDVCKLPKVSGPCYAIIQRYYHNKVSGKCEPFTYGGCKGNANNFESLAQCEKKCPPVGVKVCKLPKIVGPCEAAIRRYYFNQKLGKCEKFIFGGCQGNANNFESLADCEKICPPVEVDVCKLPRVVGPCDASIKRYYFNQRSGKCEQFTYGGCEGNKNNFETLAGCEKRCPRADVCLQPMYVGTCKAAIPRYYFNQAKGKCEMFTYGGCNGNDNNFETLLDCIERCPGAPICPPLKPGTVGTCVELCKDDSSCKGQQKCCSNGCGHVCKEPFYPECPRGQQRGCIIPQCQVAMCPAQKGAKCVGFCNGCIARFFDKFGNEVTDKCQCKKNEPESFCKVDPCKTATCPGFASKDVECRSNRCGGCKAVFYDKRGSEVKCRDSRCPATKPYPTYGCQIDCSPGSCDAGLVCCAYGCSRICVNPKQPDRRCPPPDPRIIEKLPVMLCLANGCKSSRECTKKGQICCFDGCSQKCRDIPRYDRQCPQIYDIGQITKPCPHYCTSSDDCRSDYMCCRTSCGAECIEKPVACPPGTPIAPCVPGGPCKYASCENHPGATCRANTCGTCVHEFYDDKNRIINDCLSGPIVPLPEG